MLFRKKLNDTRAHRAASLSHASNINIKLGFIFQISSLSWPACQIANRKFHVSCSNRAAEISSILEDRILGAAPKVQHNLGVRYMYLYSNKTN